MSATTASVIKGGIEYIDGEDHGPNSVQCARCGSSCYPETCDYCGGDGYVDRHEEDPMWYDEGDLWPCSHCNAEGGWYVCLSSVEWCEANPMPGREQIGRHGAARGEVDDG